MVVSLFPVKFVLPFITFDFKITIILKITMKKIRKQMRGFNIITLFYKTLWVLVVVIESSPWTPLMIRRRWELENSMRSPYLLDFIYAPCTQRLIGLIGLYALKSTSNTHLRVRDLGSPQKYLLQCPMTPIYRHKLVESPAF